MIAWYNIDVTSCMDMGKKIKKKKSYHIKNIQNEF